MNINEQKLQMIVMDICGWKYKEVQDGHLFSDPSKPLMVKRWVNPQGIVSRPYPYTTSIDAIRAEVLKLPEDKQQDFNDALQRELLITGALLFIHELIATDWCIAFVKTVAPERLKECEG